MLMNPVKVPEPQYTGRESVVTKSMQEISSTSKQKLGWASTTMVDKSKPVRKNTEAQKISIHDMTRERVMSIQTSEDKLTLLMMTQAKLDLDILGIDQVMEGD